MNDILLCYKSRLKFSWEIDDSTCLPILHKEMISWNFSWSWHMMTYCLLLFFCFSCIFDVIVLWSKWLCAQIINTMWNRWHIRFRLMEFKWIWFLLISFLLRIYNVFTLHALKGQIEMSVALNQGTFDPMLKEEKCISEAELSFQFNFKSIVSFHSFKELCKNEFVY